jgi:hypothetical protein
VYTYIEQKVEQLFADALRQYSNSKFCENPVTGECFVPRHDPIKPHKERATLNYRDFFIGGIQILERSRGA